MPYLHLSMTPWGALCTFPMISLIAMAQHLFLVTRFSLAVIQRSFGMDDIEILFYTILLL